MILSRLIRAAFHIPEREDLAEAYFVGVSAGRMEYEDGHGPPTTRIDPAELSQLSRVLLNGRIDGWFMADGDAKDSIHSGLAELLRGA